MRKLKLFFACLLMAVLSIGQMWAVDYDLVYTLDGSVTSNASGSSAYATAIDIVDNGITWNVMGNTTLNPWGIGGKNLSSTGRELFSKGAVTGNIAKIEIEHGAASSVTVNSMKVEVATDAAFSDIVSTCNPTFAANSTVTVNHPDGDDAWEDCYYRITYYLTIGSSNKKVEFKSAKFYKEKSASDPVLESITISGDLENKSYEEGQSIDFTGLTATGHYNNSSTADLTDDVEWSFAPALTAGLTSVTVTATLGEISGNKVIEGLTVAEHVVTPGTYDIPTRNDLWGTSYSGSAGSITTLSGSKNNVSITINKNTGAGMYVTSSQTRIYNGYTMIFSVPNGYAITALQFTADGSNWAGDHTADVGTMTDNKNWSGEANSVTISVKGTCRMKAVKVTYAVAAPSKTETGLAYAEADQKKLTKLGEAFTAPTLENPNNLTVAYASNNTEVAEVAANGAVTIKAVGVATITASYDEDETYQAGSASYTIGVTAHAGTEADPYVAADAKIAIDAMGTVENAYATGLVSNVVTSTLPQEGYISFYFSADGNTTGQQIEAYKCYGLNSAPFEAVTDVKTGATVVVTGTLKKYNNTYEFDQNCHLVSYEAPAVPKTHIANDQANPYTVAQAITYAADGVTYDLDDYVYVQGVVYDVKSFSNGAMNIFIKDANTENQFELYKCAGINDGNTTTPFEALTDVKAGNVVIGYGQLTVYNNVSEFKQGNYLVDLQKPITGVWISELSAEVEAGATYTLTANVLPTNATGTIDWTVESGDAYASVDENGVVTGIAEGEAVIRATAHGTEFYRECTVTVTASSTPVLTDYYEKVTSTADIVEGTYLIVYEGESVAFDGGLDDSDNDHKLDKASNTIAVDITTDHKIGVTSATEAATFYIDPTAGTIQSASGKYIGVTSNSNGLKTSDNASAYNNSFAIDGDGNAIIGAVFSESTMTLRYNTDSGQKRFRYYKTTGSPAGQLYKLANEVTKLNPELAWDKESIELTVGGLFISPELSYAQGITGTISYVSDNENVATVENGVISLVAEATGTAHITASYAGDENYKPGSAVCTIKVNPAHSIYVDTLNVNFGSVAKDATVDDQVITVTLTEVPNATATLGGSGASAFSIDPAALTASGTITISASSATAGTFAAKLTISDDAGVADSKVVNLSLTVTDPAAEETPISTSTKWVVATAADLVDGAEVIITGVKDEVVYAMGEQKSTNRAAYVASVDGEGVLTPGEGTMSFTLVAQATEGVFALRTSDGKYLYAAASGSNHLKTQDNVDVNAQWTLTATSAVAKSSTNRNIMRFNGSGTNKLFSCYSSGQTAIQFYVPKPVTPPTPVYETVREGLTAGNYYTICYPKAMTDVQGATLWSFIGKDANLAYIQQETAATIEAGKPYLLYAEAETVTAIVGTDEVEAGVNGAIHGTLALMEQDDLNLAATTAGHDLYLVIGNELRRATGDNTLGNSLPAQRAYVVVDEIGSAPAQMPAHVRSMPMHKDVATGFENLNATDKPVKLLIDGNIYILRGEKMYDATGRLVK